MSGSSVGGEDAAGRVAAACCVATWTDRVGGIHAIVVPLPGRDILPSDEAYQRFRAALARVPHEISRTVDVSADAEEIAAWLSAGEVLLRTARSTEDSFVEAQARAGRWWHRLLPGRPGQLRRNADRRYRDTLEAAEAAYQAVVGDLVSRVWQQCRRTEAEERRLKMERQLAEAQRASARQDVRLAVGNAKVWQILVEDGTAFIRRGDVPPGRRLPPPERPWSESMTLYELALDLADLLYSRMMVAPQVSRVVWDSAAVEEGKRELAAADVTFDELWSDQYSQAESWAEDHHSRNRRGGYSSGGFI